MPYTTTIGARTYRFDDLKTLLAKAGSQRSGDELAGAFSGYRE
jgi:ethanolamine ammonia-lyase large subunit